LILQRGRERKGLEKDERGRILDIGGWGAYEQVMTGWLGEVDQIFVGGPMGVAKGMRGAQYDNWPTEK